MPVSRFLEWCAYLKLKVKEDFQRVDKIDWYLAQIAAKIDSTRELKRPELATAENNLLTFSDPKPKVELTDEQRMARAMRNKAIWLGIAGLNTDGSKA